MTDKPKLTTEEDDLRARIAELESQVEEKAEVLEGVAEGSIRCLTFNCPFGEKKAKFTKDTYVKYFADERGNLTDRVENSTTYWHLRDHPANCPDCSAPLNHLPPGAQSVFPKGFRYQYGEPVG
jgi:hypothetical protein